MVWALSKESLLEKCKSRLSLVKCSATCGPDFIRQGQGTLLPVCWLDILQSNIVYGCRVLASWVHVQKSYCFQVKPGLIMQWQRDIHTYTQQRTRAPTRFFTRTSSTLKSSAFSEVCNRGKAFPSAVSPTRRFHRLLGGSAVQNVLLSTPHRLVMSHERMSN